VPLSFFPTPRETDAEVTGMEHLLRLQPNWTIADLCCGAGRHLLRLQQQGYSVVGLDLSPLLLDQARQDAAALGLSPALVRGDVRRLPFADATFDVALNLFNSFGYCECDEDNELVLQETARCLRPGGQFLLETRNAKFQILFSPVSQHVRTADGSTLHMSCRYRSEDKRLAISWRERDHTGPQVYRAALRLYSLEELEALLEQVGLEVVAVYGDYCGRPFDGFERLLLMHARKPSRAS
jgi:SAM-dependent methyltransferase